MEKLDFGVNSRFFVKNLSLALIFLAMANNFAVGESLFRGSVSHSIHPSQPRALFGTVKARTIGDLVTVIVSEEVDFSDNLQLSVNKSSSTTDSFSGLLNRLLPGKLVPNLNDYGGGVQAGDQSSIARKAKLNDTITAQVMQVLPNGNLLIQGKKTSINAGERMEVLMSGIVDPRLIDNTGSIESNLVANLQVAVTGKGTVSRSNSEGVLNKVIRQLF